MSEQATGVRFAKSGSHPRVAPAGLPQRLRRYSLARPSLAANSARLPRSLISPSSAAPAFTLPAGLLAALADSPRHFGPSSSTGPSSSIGPSSRIAGHLARRSRRAARTTSVTMSARTPRSQLHQIADPRGRCRPQGIRTRGRRPPPPHGQQQGHSPGGMGRNPPPRYPQWMP